MAEFYCTWTLYKVSVNIVFSNSAKQFAFQNIVSFIPNFTFDYIDYKNACFSLCYVIFHILLVIYDLEF